MNKEDMIYYIEHQMKEMGMFTKIHDSDIHIASFIWNKVDRKRAHIKLNPARFTREEFLAVALHELGHAQMYAKYTTIGYIRGTNEWHELGAWNIALRHAESLGIKLPKEYIISCLTSYGIGNSQIEGMLSQWNNSLYSLSYA